MFESPPLSKLVDRLGRLWGVPGQAFQCGGTWGPEAENGDSSGVSLAVMYPGSVTGEDTHLTVETSVRRHASFNLFQHYLMSANMDESTLPIVIERWRTPVPTELGPADFTFVGHDHSWAGDATFQGQTIRLTGTGRRWQDLELILLEASDVLSLDEFAARVIARREMEQS